jgi:hypothetical protein
MQIEKKKKKKKKFIFWKFFCSFLLRPGASLYLLGGMSRNLPSGINLDDAPAPTANYETRLVQLAKHVAVFAILLGVTKAVALVVDNK